MGEGVADHLRLLVDLLGHEVAVIPLFRQQAAGRIALDAALDRMTAALTRAGREEKERMP